MHHRLLEFGVLVGILVLLMALTALTAVPQSGIMVRASPMEPMAARLPGVMALASLMEPMVDRLPGVMVPVLQLGLAVVRPPGTDEHSIELWHLEAWHWVYSVSEISYKKIAPTSPFTLNHYEAMTFLILPRFWCFTSNPLGIVMRLTSLLRLSVTGLFFIDCWLYRYECSGNIRSS
jgi:hypothetical protein